MINFSSGTLNNFIQTDTTGGNVTNTGTGNGWQFGMTFPMGLAISQNQVLGLRGTAVNGGPDGNWGFSVDSSNNLLFRMAGLAGREFRFFDAGNVIILGSIDSGSGLITRLGKLTLAGTGVPLNLGTHQSISPARQRLSQLQRSTQQPH